MSIRVHIADAEYDGGEDEEPGDPLQRAIQKNPRRDMTALTIVDVDRNYPDLPTYRTVHRRLWSGVKHQSLYTTIMGEYHHWKPQWIVIDSTGVGAGLASFLVMWHNGPHHTGRKGHLHAPTPSAHQPGPDLQS